MSESLQSAPKSAKGQSSSPGVLSMLWMLILGLVFLSVGVGVVLYAMSIVAQFKAMRRWEETPAKILGADLQSHRGSKGGTTYSIKVSYEYSWRGAVYHGTRARLLDSFSDSHAGWQRRAVAEYQAAMAQGRSVPCYVNPSNPQEAMLKREMPWGAWSVIILFGLIFGGAGLAILGAMVSMGRKVRELSALRAQWPDQPWRWDKGWAEGRIVSSTKTGALGLTGFALVWNMIGWLPVILGGEELLAKGNLVLLLVLLFPLVGILLIVKTVQSWRAWLRFGDAVFRLTEIPGAIGGTLCGTIWSPCRLRPSADVKLNLACTQTVRSGKNTSTNTLWQEDRTVRCDGIPVTPEGVVIPVVFQIPPECQSTDRDEKIAWKLEMNGNFGGSVSANFEVPVFRSNTASVSK